MLNIHCIILSIVFTSVICIDTPYPENQPSSSSSRSCVHDNEPGGNPHCGPDEVVDDYANGGCIRRNCSQLADPQICIDALDYTKGCRCKDGHLRNEKGVCVPVTECPIPACKEGEIFDFCPGFCQPTCNVDQSLILCRPSPQPGDPECNPACRCADGLYRTAEGACVPKEFCPPQCPNNEVYEPCPDPYIPNDCSSIWSRYRPCPPRPEDCKPTCRCPDGQYRNKIGQCITTEECLQCRGPNEYFSCGGECDNECDKLSRQSIKNCPFINIQCNRKCYCEDGYARDANNICIPINECPPECPVNERYVNNVNEICGAKTCSELGKPLPCLEDDCDNSGPPGCICIDGYTRNSDGVCVPTTECPACGGDFNATSGPGTFCITCDNYKNEKEVACILVYKLNGCACRDGYVYNNDTKQCILPHDCPRKHKVEEC